MKRHWRNRKYRLARSALAAGFAAVLACAFAAPAQADAESDYNSAIAAYNAKDYAGAERIAGQVLDSYTFDPDQRAIVLAGRGEARRMQGKNDLALQDFNDALASIAADKKGNVVEPRLFTLLAMDRGGPAFDDLMTLTQSYPANAKDVPIASIFQVGRFLLKEKRHDDLLALMLALKKIDYAGPDPTSHTDFLYIYLIQELAAHKRAAEAAPYIGEMEHYNLLMQLRTNRIYQPLWSNPSVSVLLQPRDFAARQLADAQKRVAQFPKKLGMTAELVTALRLNGRYDEAVATAENALKNLSAYDTDDNDVLWAKNALADALLGQGKFDEANAVLSPLLTGSAKDNPNLVNQFINFGGMLLDEGRFAAAIASADKAEGYSSPYGEKWVQQIKACAQAHLGNKTGAEAIFLDMLKAPEENYEAVTQTAMCLQHADQAAALIVKQLASDDTSSTVLASLQTCRENPKRPPLARERYATLLTLRNRPEVKEAIAKAGVIVATPVICGDDSD